MNIQEANAYVNAAPDATERARRKAETFHIRYGSPTRLIASGGHAGSKSMALNYMIQSQHAQKVMAELRFDRAKYDADWWEREGDSLLRRITRHRETRRRRRILAQKLRRKARAKLAGCDKP